jgi:EpsI family protein
MTLRVSLVVVLLLAAATGRTFLVPSSSPTRAESLASFPQAIGEWSGHDSPLDPDVVQVTAVDDYLNRYYRSPSGVVGLYIGYYKSQVQGESLHSPLNCLPGTGWQPVESGTLILPSTASAHAINKVVVEKGLDRLVVLYWYQTERRVTASEYSRKLFLIADAFSRQRTDVALVRIAAPIENASAKATNVAVAQATPFADRVLPEVQKHLFQ